MLSYISRVTGKKENIPLPKFIGKPPDVENMSELINGLSTALSYKKAGTLPSLDLSKAKSIYMDDT